MEQGGAMLETMERKFRKVSARVTPELYRSVGAAAAAQGTTRELWVTEALERYLVLQGQEVPQVVAPTNVKLDGLDDEDLERVRRYTKFLRRMAGREELKDAAETLYGQISALAKRGQV